MEPYFNKRLPFRFPCSPCLVEEDTALVPNHTGRRCLVMALVFPLTLLSGFLRTRIHSSERFLWLGLGSLVLSWQGHQPGPDLLIWLSQFPPAVLTPAYILPVFSESVLESSSFWRTVIRLLHWLPRRLRISGTLGRVQCCITAFGCSGRGRRGPMCLFWHPTPPPPSSPPPSNPHPTPPPGHLVSFPLPPCRSLSLSIHAATVP